MGNCVPCYGKHFAIDVFVTNFLLRFPLKILFDGHFLRLGSSDHRAFALRDIFYRVGHDSRGAIVEKRSLVEPT